MKIKTLRDRRTGIIHAAAEFYDLGRKYPPIIGTMCMCNTPMTEGAFNRLREEELEHTRVNCESCCRTPEFEGQIRWGAPVRITLSSV